MDHLATIFTEKHRPRTNYPNQLAKHLTERFHLAQGARLLEIGCGRAEFLIGFKRVGLSVMGTDSCLSARDLCEDKDVEISQCMLGRDSLPYANATFDIVFSKSLLEHMRDPHVYMAESLRVLRPGGTLITMTPDWESCHQKFYDDFTHVQPYTDISLLFLYEQYALTDILVEKFRQLPIVWKYPALRYVCRFVSPFVPVRTKNRFLRWSRELMLLAVGRKSASCS